MTGLPRDAMSKTARIRDATGRWGEAPWRPVQSAGTAGTLSVVQPGHSLWLEAQQGFAFKAQPMMICGYRLDMAGLVALTAPAVLAELDMAHADPACAWRSTITAACRGTMHRGGEGRP